MVKSPPVAAFVMTQPEFLFEFLVVALDHPAVLADPDQPFQREFHWQTRQPVAAWLSCAGGPLDQNGSGTDSQVIAAIQQAIALKDTYNIRVINMSLGRPVFES